VDVTCSTVRSRLQLPHLLRILPPSCREWNVAVASDRNNPRRELVIRPGHHDSEYLPDLWRYRELFYFLAWRDILVRYKQTAIGVLWSILRPFLTMVVFSVVFGKLAKLPSEGVPYPILVYAAMLPWQFFANSLSEASNSLVGNANLISKVYFPRLIIPAGAVIKPGGFSDLVHDPRRHFGLSLGVVALMLVLGLWHFRKMEKTFADVI